MSNNQAVAKSDFEERLRNVENALQTHLIRCEEQNKVNRWIMIIGFVLLGVLLGEKSILAPVVKALAAGVH